MKKLLIYFTLFIIPVIVMIILFELFHFLEIKIKIYTLSAIIYPVYFYFLKSINKKLIKLFNTK